MIADFLRNCSCVLPEAQEDYQAILRRFPTAGPGVGFMPANTIDLYPVFALHCTNGKEIVSPDIYFMPVGSPPGPICSYFERMIRLCYSDDQWPGFPEIGLEKIMLLRSPSTDHFFTMNENVQYNVALCSLIMPDQSHACVFIIPEKPHDCWKKIMETYSIPCDILIDPHKGFGDWFYSAILFNTVMETVPAMLRPRYYFRNRCSSLSRPEEGFSLVLRIPDKIMEHPEVSGYQKEIYEVDWDAVKPTSHPTAP